MVELADNAITAGASGLAVLDVPAALRLRAHGFTGTLFAWLHGRSTDFAAAIDANVDLGISSLTELGSVVEAPGVARVHLKIDTGLHRNGFSVNDWRDACLRAREAEMAGDIAVIGVWSHLADASDDADARAIARFSEALTVASECGLNPTVRHIAASSAAMRNRSSRFDVVRVGIAAYGISPYDDTDGKGLGLKPVITLSSEVSSYHDGVSVIGAGWHDGVPQVQSGMAWVSIDGVPAAIRAVHPLFTLVDGEHAVGATVDIVGGTGANAEDWAGWANTIGDEIVTGIPAHVRRVFVRP
jgi:alanine racemase